MIAKIISVDGTELRIECNTVEKQEMVENMFQSACNNDDEYWKYLKNAWKK